MRTLGLAFLVLASCAEASRSAPSKSQEPPPAAREVALQAEVAETTDPPAPEKEPPKKALLTGKWTQSLVWEKPRYDSFQLGYFRAGARVARAQEPIAQAPGVHPCGGKWYAIEPQGFVCDGSGGVTTQLDDPSASTAKDFGPKEEPLPFGYGMSYGTHMYVRAPTPEQQLTTEGDVKGYITMMQSMRAKMAPEKLPPSSALPVSELPGFLEGGAKSPTLVPWNIPKEAITAGYAIPATRLAFVAAFDLPGPAGPRTFYLTSEHMLVPADRIRAARLSDFHGVELSGDVSLPLAWSRIPQQKPVVFRLEPDGTAKKTELVLPYQSWFPIAEETTVKGVGRFYTMKKLPEGLTDPGGAPDTKYLVRTADVTRLDAAANTPEKVGSDEVWIDVDIFKQTLVLYSGKTPLYATLISTGTGGKTHRTPIGTFRVYQKHFTTRMSAEEKPPEAEGDEPEKAYRFDDVPYVQYIYKGIALHAAFWHDGFGMPRSHGCINLSPRDAKWIFGRTEPKLPDGWHGISAGRGNFPVGSVVVIHG